MKFALNLIQLFTLSDFVIAALTAGSTWRTRGRDGRRSLLAVGLAIFFAGFAITKVAEFCIFIYYREAISKCLGLIPQGYSTGVALSSGAKTVALWFAWFAVTNSNRDQQGHIRRWLSSALDRLRGQEPPIIRN